MNNSLRDLLTSVKKPLGVAYLLPFSFSSPLIILCRCGVEVPAKFLIFPLLTINILQHTFPCELLSFKLNVQ